MEVISLSKQQISIGKSSVDVAARVMAFGFLLKQWFWLCNTTLLLRGWRTCLFRKLLCLHMVLMRSDIKKGKQIAKSLSIYASAPQQFHHFSARFQAHLPPPPTFSCFPHVQQTPYRARQCLSQDSSFSRWKSPSRAPESQ